MTRPSGAGRRMPMTLPSPHITSNVDQFAHKFAHLLLGVNDRIKNVSHVFVETLVAQRLTSRRYSCRLAALAGCAGAASCFLQAIEPTHCFCFVDKPVKPKNKVAGGSDGGALAHYRMINDQHLYRADSGMARSAIESGNVPQTRSFALSFDLAALASFRCVRRFRPVRLQHPPPAAA